MPVASPPAANPFLLRLARALLAKAERSSGPGPVRMPLDPKTAPELHAAVDAEQQQLLAMQLDDLCATGWVALLMDPPRAFASSLPDRKPRLELRDFESLAAWAHYTPQAQRWQRQWLDHLAARWSVPATSARGLPDNAAAVLDYLARNPMTLLEGLPLDEATQCLSALLLLCRSGRPMALREASARVFQGRSKLLDSRDELLRLLGARPGQFTEAPIQLLVAPADDGLFEDVLFVENLVTFEHMADVRAAAWKRSLLVYAAGFRGSARRLRSRSGCRLYLRGTSAIANLDAIESWLFGAAEVPVSFFGDLDFAGMQILASLREGFPHASAWQHGYQTLAELLKQGRGHLPEQASKVQQVDVGNTGCPYADHTLLPEIRLRGRFVDQEAFDPEMDFG